MPNFFYTRQIVFGWFDFKLPASYVAGSNITVNLNASVQGTGVFDPTQCAVQAFGFQFNGGSYTAAPTRLKPPHDWTTSPGTVIYDYGTFDRLAVNPTATAGLLSAFVTPVPAIATLTVPGITQAYQLAVGGSIPFDGAIPPILQPGISFIEDAPAGYISVGYWPTNGPDNYGGFVPTIGVVPQVASGTQPLQPGATVSIGIYAFCSGDGSGTGNWIQITAINVITSGAVTTNVPITKVLGGFAGGVPGSVTPMHYVNFTPSGLYTDFYLI